MEEAQAVAATSATNFVIPLLASLLGGALTLVGVLIAHHLEKRAQRTNEKALVRGFLQAVLDEIETIWQRYMDTAGAHVETSQEGVPFDAYYNVSNDYFTVYHGNSFLLSRVEDDDLRKSIVTTYTTAKGFIDTMRMNNYLVEKYSSTLQFSQTLNSQTYQDQAQNYQNLLVKYAKTVRDGHADLKQRVQNLTTDLRRALKQ